ncbi:hypothetical protein [Marinibactrum halimedae]|uniref:Uncharacterized protein n=1 Tax=Marinibactrum halimedae TaxID=1444977 RepID=A0AA37T6M3_9GAMM|nr:hypothetical protein [Marinibactrum halimedae]MCD9458916.1 hypothetical protein [Marinibactrum halimedae]GLS27764.1 hypothetical protein GCM10007877_34830 [Marinibactrum halimedae]
MNQYQALNATINAVMPCSNTWHEIERDINSYEPVNDPDAEKEQINKLIESGEGNEIFCEAISEAEPHILDSMRELVMSGKKEELGALVLNTVEQYFKGVCEFRGDL